MELRFGELNIWAVLVAAAVTFVLGGVWYTALFGQARLRLLGWSEDKVRECQARRPPPVFFGGMLAAYVVVALAVGLLAANLEVVTLGAGVLLGLTLGVGVAAAVGFTGFLAADYPAGVFYIDAAFQVVFLALMGAIIGAWQ